MKKIEPTILKGTRDFTPQEVARRSFVMRKIRAIFEKFGYAELETPILSPAETILGKYGEEGDRLTYSWTDAGERQVALPYDLTVPFARYAAANWRELPMPFKRYQIQRVWRAEKPQKGRLREFYQCDIDVIGTKSLRVEAEIARVIVDVLTELGIPDFKIKINSRRLMNQVLAKFGIGENSAEVIRAIDKLDKTGPAPVAEELRRLGVEEADKLMILLSPAETQAKTLAKFGAFDTSEITETIKLAKELGVDEDYFEFDPSLARGLDYYTGIIFEVVSTAADFGTLCAGGRYDNLTELFEVNLQEGQTASGMGVAFGFERILLVLEELGLLKDVKAGAKAVVAQFPGLEKEAAAVYRELLAAGIPAEIYFEPAKLDKQLKYADKKEIPFVCLVGPEESKTGMVTLKNLETGEERKMTSAEAVEALK